MSRLTVLASLILLGTLGAGLGAAPALADLKPFCIGTNDRQNSYCVDPHLPVR